MEPISTNPSWVSLTIVFSINLMVIILTYVLFHTLRSTATITKGKWAAGGAIAGFIILTMLELHLIKFFSPATVSSLPSYKVVYSFYNDLQYKKLDDAWELLHPQLQEDKWHRNIEAFKNGYKDTLRIRLLAIILLEKSSPASHDYVVYYVDQVDSPIIPGLENVSSKTLKELVSLAENVDSVRQVLSSGGFDTQVFDNITMCDLAAPNRGVKISWILENCPSSNLNRKKFDELFPVKRTVEFISAYRVITESTDQGWKIRKTESLTLKD
jgi:hypothetical protein